MQIHKITVSQAVELFKKKDLWAKIALTVLFLSYLSFCRACFFNPIAGDTYPVYENNYPGDLYGFRAKNKGAKQCKLGGKKIFLERETQNESFWYDFFVELRTNHFGMTSLLILGLFMFGISNIRMWIMSKKIF